MRMLGILGAALLALALPGTALAANGYATGNVNMRSGPGTQFSVITTVQAGSPVTIHGCSSWCDISWRGVRGFVSGKYVTAGHYSAPVHAAPVYVAPVYAAPVYAAPLYRPAPAFSFGFGFSSVDRDRHFFRDRDDCDTCGRRGRSRRR